MTKTISHHPPARIFTLMLLFTVLFWPTPNSYGASQYQVFAFNDLGMHCYDSDYSVFTILPPFNVLHAQVLRKGGLPQLLDDSQVDVYYRAKRDPSGSINRTSGSIKGVPKTNFWDYVQGLFGLTLQVNQGIPVPPSGGPSAMMPGPRNVRQPFVHGYNFEMNWFTAAGIPITQLDDRLRSNPYPLMNVHATRNNKASEVFRRLFPYLTR